MYHRVQYLPVYANSSCVIAVDSKVASKHKAAGHNTKCQVTHKDILVIVIVDLSTGINVVELKLYARCMLHAGALHTAS